MQVKKIISSGYFVFAITLLLISSFAFSNFTASTVSVSVDKMNVLYIGVDNPVTVAVAGVPTDQTTVESDELRVQNKGNGQYNLQANKPGNAILKVKAGDNPSSEVMFRVKRIPDPVAKVFNSSGGTIDAHRFQKSTGVDAVIQCFEYDAKCSIISYNLTLVPKMEDPVEARNNSAQYEEHTLKLVQSVKAGDIVYVDNVRCKCPGDAATRNINSLVFKMR